MKKIYSLIMASAIAMTANAQLVINENFTGYTNGALGTKGGWVQVDNGTDVQVATTTPLTYSGYASGAQYITVSSNDGTDPWKPFSTAISTGSEKTIFISFLVRVTAAEESNGGPDYSIALRDTNSTNLAHVPCKFYVADQAGSGTNLQFGIAVGTSSPNYTNAVFSYNTTYLIVIRYDIITGGSNNDDAYLWVNPSLAAEPAIATATGNTGATQTNSGEAGYGSTLQVLQIFQSSSSDSPDGAYDAFRVAEGATSAAAWTNLAPAGAPLPVQLTSFNAGEEGLSTKLVWHVAEESGITSYVIEKSTDGRNFTAIGSVKAANLKTYGYSDAQAASENTYYRLKMVEIDGTYKYSYIINVKSKLSMNISLSPNPVKSMLMIQHPKSGVTGHIQIVNATGQLVKDIRLPANAVISTIDMSGLTNGLYHVVFKNGSGVLTKTILKQ